MELPGLEVATIRDASVIGGGLTCYITMLAPDTHSHIYSYRSKDISQGLRKVELKAKFYSGVNMS